VKALGEFAEFLRAHLRAQRARRGLSQTDWRNAPASGSRAALSPSIQASAGKPAPTILVCHRLHAPRRA
jgi:hypothetical protein